MIHYQYHNSKLLFIGINPHEGSYRRAVPFSNNKMFWYLLNQAGLIQEKMEDLRHDEKLLEIYETKFNKVYQLGLVNVVDRPSNNATLLKKGEEAPGVRNIHTIIQLHMPPVVCFVGKVTYQKFSGLKKVDFGWQPDIGESKIYVMRFPIRGEAAIRVEDLKIVAKAAGLPGFEK